MGYYRYRVKLKLKDWIFNLTKNEKPKIFCLSFQRTGTTSTGVFFKDHNFRVATSSVSKMNEWGRKYIEGNYEAVFESAAFKTNDVFEDGPWWFGDFYKVLFHRFPDAKFILLERKHDKWFDSMMRHSDNKNPGNSFRHSKLYHREREFYNLNLNEKFIYNNEKDNLLPLTEKHRKHYTDIYRLRNNEVKEFFKTFGPQRLFNARLEDENLWCEMGGFSGFEVNSNYNVHANKTTTEE